MQGDGFALSIREILDRSDEQFGEIEMERDQVLPAIGDDPAFADA
jgi:hypothetical protein